MDKQEAFIIYLELKEAAEEIQVIEQTLKENCIDPIPTKNLFSSNFNKMMEDLASNIKKLHSYIIVENDIELMKEVSLIPKHPFFFYPLHCGRTLTDASELFSKIQAFLSEIRIEYEKLAKETNSNNSKHKEVIPSQKEEKKEEQISINVAELKSYFKIPFINNKIGNKKKGDKYETYFEMLIDDLQKKRTMKDYARFALIIYDSDKLIDCMKPNTFEEWYTTFCRIIGCNHGKGYKRCKLKDRGLENLKRNFYYLQ